MAIDASALAALRERLLDALPTDLSALERRLSTTLYRQLAEGDPVELGSLAAATGAPAGKIREILSGWPGVYTDDEGRIIGYWGLTIAEMAHGLHVDGRRLFTWCAWDTLFIPAILGRSARVESSCPVTGEPVRLVVSPRRVESCEPATTVLSFLELERGALSDVQTRFCRFIHFLASEAAGRSWVEDHPGTFLLDLDQGFELGAAKTRAQLGDSLPP